MKVSLFIPCLVDQFFPSVGMNLFKILKKIGLSVNYPLEQTCCGQPAFNGGYHADACELAQRFLEIFRGSEYIVTPSGSCASMVKIFYPEILDHSTYKEPLQEITKIFLSFLTPLLPSSHDLPKILNFSKYHREQFHDLSAP